MGLAHHIASWSKDRSRKVGAVIVDGKRILSVGYNGPPEGVNDDVEDRHIKPKKLMYVVHAEANALYFCSATKGATMYVTLFPCAGCAQAIIQRGIKRVICNTPDWNDKSWGESFQASKEMMEEAGVEIILLSDETKIES